MNSTACVDAVPARLLNEDEAAGCLGCSVAFLRRCRLLAKGGPSWIKVGRLVRYAPNQLKEYMVANTKHGLRARAVTNGGFNYE